MSRMLLTAALLLSLLQTSWGMPPDDPGTQYDLAVSADGKMAATCGNEQEIHLWSVSARKLVRLLRGHRGSVYAVAFSPDGRTLASGSGDGTIRLWDGRTGQSLGLLAHPRSKVTALAWLPDGRLAASWDNRLHLVDVRSGRARAVLPDVSAFALRTSPSGRWLAIAGGGAREGSVVLWDIASGKTVRRYSMTWAVEGVDVARDGRVAGGSGDGHVSVWDGARRLVDCKPFDNVYFVRFSPDGSRILTVGNRAVLMLDATTGQTVLELKGGSHDAFLPDGKTVLAASGIVNVHLLDASTGAVIAPFAK